MRTTDFSRAPKQGQAEAMVVVEVARGSRGRAEASALSPGEIATALQRADGHIWSKRFTRRGFSQGVVACFATARDAHTATEALGRAGTGAATSTAVLAADPSGYSNGVWRAEGNVMAHIPTFTPTSVEAARGSAGPPVARPTTTGTATATATADRNPESSRYPRARATTFGVSIQEQGGGIPVTDARAMFIGATKYRGPRALVQLSRTWYPMVARMQTLRGYVWHTVYWEPPFTLGTLAFFATRDDLLSFARLPAHRTLMQWITRDTRNGTGGYIRLHLAPGEAPADNAVAPEDSTPPAPTAAQAHPAPATPAPPAPGAPEPPAPRADGEAP
ncbi:hypothetical protein [Subtercola boreus]|uniref:hypothetical protein n=1 Tax=Subtercola boreus TaxID=120213 RepID=UPI00116C04D4|nr:hypothetical protein [Subtercola boreus]TQL56075.1 hypothetical protein FB464_3655 [Subtercola boreus]